MNHQKLAYIIKENDENNDEDNNIEKYPYGGYSPNLIDFLP